MFVFAAQNKRLNVQFAGGEEPQDMDLALRSIADGTIDVRPWLGTRDRPEWRQRRAGQDRRSGLAGADGGRPETALDQARGKVSVKRAPSPGALSTMRSPPMARASRRAI